MHKQPHSLQNSFSNASSSNIFYSSHNNLIKTPNLLHYLSTFKMKSYYGQITNVSKHFGTRYYVKHEKYASEEQ